MVCMTVWWWYNRHRYTGMMNAIITDTAHQCTADRSETTATHDDVVSILFFGHMADCFTWVASVLPNQLAVILKIKEKNQ